MNEQRKQRNGKKPQPPVVHKPRRDPQRTLANKQRRMAKDAKLQQKNAATYHEAPTKAPQYNLSFFLKQRATAREIKQRVGRIAEVKALKNLVASMDKLIVRARVIEKPQTELKREAEFAENAP